MSLKLNPRHQILTVICLGFTAMIAFFYVKGLLYGNAERTSRDWLLTNSEARHPAPNPDIILLAIDENTRSLDNLFADDLEKSPTLRLMKKGFPWNRQVYADIIDRLANAGAKAIVLDVVFPTPREGDDAFRAALLRHRDKVVFATNLAPREEENASGSAVGGMPSHILPTAELLPPPDGPSWLGFANIRADEDGLVRRVTFRTSLQEFFGIPAGDKTRELLSLSARGLEKAGMADRIPRGHKAVMFRFAEDINPLSLHEIFVDAQWNAPPYEGGKLFRDKIVVIGATQQSSEDRVQTPFGVKLGVQIHLNAINAALNGEFLEETSTTTDLTMIGMGGLLAWIVGGWIRRPLLRLVVLALLMLAYYEVAQHLANTFNVVPLLLSPLLALATSGIFWSAWEQVLDRIERQRTRRALDRYVGHDVASEVMDNPQTYFNSLGGVRKEVTVLFSDVRGFTTLTETADPHELVAQLNEYYGVMVDIVFAHQGTLDKFIGDAVMAHWGSIVDGDPATNAAQAVNAALEMRKALVHLNADWKQRGIREWKIGIGINHGRPIVGNIGSAGKLERYDLTVVGDAVNLASRLEGATKQFGIDFCIGERVAALVSDKFILRSVDLIIVKGKTKPVEIFAVLGKRGEPEPPWLARHDEAMRLYRAGDFAAAEKIWRDILAQAPVDGISETFIARCTELQADPPAGPWTGVYEMKSK